MVDPIPVPYQSSFEILAEHESETNAGLIETITKIQNKVLEDTGHAHRGVHAKSHGMLVGQFQVLDGLPAALAQGLFAKPATYPVVMRFSTIPGDMLDDSISVPRGVGLKVVGVPGARVAGSEGDVTQDFVLANGPAFAKPDPKGFLSTLKLLASTTDKAPGLKKALSVVMRGAEKVVESVGGKSPTLMTLGGYPETHILGDPFYSQVPLLYGEYMAKVSLKPYSPSLRALTDASLDVTGKPNGLREAVMEFFSRSDAEWAFQVQLCTNIEQMPLEDASKPWSEDESPYITVARITMPRQVAWNASREKAIDDGMAFSPWHAIADHRPLGSINRVRKTVYDMAARFRAQHNRTTVGEPRTADDLPH